MVSEVQEIGSITGATLSGGDRIFKLLVTGSRDWDDPEKIWHILNILNRKLGHREATLIHGAARGADRMAAMHWISLDRVDRPRHTEPYPVSDLAWRRQGNRAGYIRNAKMVALKPQLCIAFIQDNSPGATMCADLAEKKGIKTLRYRRSTS